MQNTFNGQAGVFGTSVRLSQLCKVILQLLGNEIDYDKVLKEGVRVEHENEMDADSYQDVREHMSNPSYIHTCIHIHIYSHLILVSMRSCIAKEKS